MENNDIKVSEISDNLYKLLERAEKRIRNNEEKEKRKKEEEERQKELERKRRDELARQRAERAANSIIELVSKILSNAQERKGDISRVDGSLGSLSEYSSNYSIDDQGLTICLDYSNGYYIDSRIGWGFSFLEGDNDLYYLQTILREYGISVKRITGGPEIHPYADTDQLIIKFNMKKKDTKEYIKL